MDRSPAENEYSRLGWDATQLCTHSFKDFTRLLRRQGHTFDIAEVMESFTFEQESYDIGRIVMLSLQDSDINTSLPATHTLFGDGALMAWHHATRYELHERSQISYLEQYIATQTARPRLIVGEEMPSPDKIQRWVSMPSDEQPSKTPGRYIIPFIDADMWDRTINLGIIGSDLRLGFTRLIETPQ